MTDLWNRWKEGPCYVIAEAGVNHNGDLDTALRLIDAAAGAGASACKFQAFRADELSEPGAHRDMLAKLEMPEAWYHKLIAHCAEVGVDFLSSPFDVFSARLLWSLGVPALKIGSGELTNLAFLERLPDFHLPLIVSTGMANMRECVEAKRVLSVPHVAWLHCVSAYPARIEDYNLRCLEAMRYQLGQVIGVSDHTTGVSMGILAVARGASIIEKHITLDRASSGPDHHMSLEPSSFKAYVDGIRMAEAALGDGLKFPVEAELATMPIARRVKTENGFKRKP